MDAADKALPKEGILSSTTVVIVDDQPNSLRKWTSALEQDGQFESVVGAHVISNDPRQYPRLTERIGSLFDGGKSKVVLLLDHDLGFSDGTTGSSWAGKLCKDFQVEVEKGRLILIGFTSGDPELLGRLFTLNGAKVTISKGDPSLDGTIGQIQDAIIQLAGSPASA